MVAMALIRTDVPAHLHEAVAALQVWTSVIGAKEAARVKGGIMPRQNAHIEPALCETLEIVEAEAALVGQVPVDVDEGDDNPHGAPRGISGGAYRAVGRQDINERGEVVAVAGGEGALNVRRRGRGGLHISGAAAGDREAAGDEMVDANSDVRLCCPGGSRCGADHVASEVSVSRVGRRHGAA